MKHHDVLPSKITKNASEQSAKVKKSGIWYVRGYFESDVSDVMMFFCTFQSNCYLALLSYWLTTVLYILLLPSNHSYPLVMTHSWLLKMAQSKVRGFFH